jgi:hypothetical protein
MELGVGAVTGGCTIAMEQQLLERELEEVVQEEFEVETQGVRCRQVGPLEEQLEGKR